VFEQIKGNWHQLAMGILQSEDESLYHEENLVNDAKQNLRTVSIKLFLVTLVLVAVSIGIMYLRFRMFGR
jgi:hypothetical protein